MARPIPQSNYTAGRDGGTVDLMLASTTRLQRWLAKAIRSVFPNADLSGPDVSSGQPFKD